MDARSEHFGLKSVGATGHREVRGPHGSCWLASCAARDWPTDPLDDTPAASAADDRSLLPTN